MTKLGTFIGGVLPLALAVGMGTGEVPNSGSDTSASPPRAGNRVALSGTGQDGAKKEVQPRPEVDPPTVDVNHPLRGWTLLHDGNFDPITNSAYSVLGCQKVITFAQGDDPQSYESGVIDIDGVLVRLVKRYPDGIEGYVNLDWEQPFFDFLHAGPTHPRFQSTMENLLEFVRRFKGVFPGAVVTHYNLPALPFWGTTEDGRAAAWNDISDKCRSEYFDRMEALKPVLDEFDWFCPRFYDFVPSPEIPEEWRERQIASEIGHRAAIVRWLRTYVDGSERPGRKIIPVTRTAWVGGAGGYEKWVDRDIPVDEFLHEQLKPAMKNGADGIMLWEGYEMWMLGSAFRPPDEISTELRDTALEFFRAMGILATDAVTNWASAEEKRAFRKALGIRQIRYVASIAGQMRSGPKPPGHEEQVAGPDREGKERVRIRLKPRPGPKLKRTAGRG